MPEAPIIPPEDLVALKADWYAAREHADQIAREKPEGELLHLPGAIERWLLSEDQGNRLGAAREEVRRLTLEIYRHDWKRNPPADRGAAEKALNEAAKARLAENRAAPVG